MTEPYCFCTPGMVVAGCSIHDHAPGEPRQFKSLTDKPGLWVASCLCGKYTCQPQGTAEATIFQVERHIRGKTG